MVSACTELDTNPQEDRTTEPLRDSEEQSWRSCQHFAGKWLLTNNISILLSNLLKSFWIPNMSKYVQSRPSVNIMAVLTNSDPAYRKAPPFIVDIWNFQASVKAETTIRRRDFKDWGRNKDCLNFSIIFSSPVGRQFPATEPGRSQ